MMKVITWQSKLDDLLFRWKAQYSDYIRKGDDRYGHVSAYKALLAEKKLTRERTHEIIGNTSWTDCICTECGNDSGCYVQIGAEPDYDSSTAWICQSCLKKALGMAYAALKAEAAPNMTLAEHIAKQRQSLEYCHVEIEMLTAERDKAEQIRADLLATCKAALAHFESFGGGTWPADRDMMARLSEVIKKAEGE